MWIKGVRRFSFAPWAARPPTKVKGERKGAIKMGWFYDECLVCHNKVSKKARFS
jgi:hypothetical protein